MLEIFKKILFDEDKSKKGSKNKSSFYYYDDKKKDEAKPYVKPEPVTSKLSSTQPTGAKSNNAVGSTRLDLKDDFNNINHDGVYPLYPQASGNGHKKFGNSGGKEDTKKEPWNSTFTSTAYKKEPVYPNIKLKFLALNLKEFSTFSEKNKVLYLIDALGIINPKKMFNTLIVVVDTTTLKSFEFKDTLGVKELSKSISSLEIVDSDENQIYDLIDELSKKYDKFLLKDNILSFDDVKYRIKEDIDVIFMCPPEDKGSTTTIEQAKASIATLRENVNTRYICMDESTITIPAMLGFREVRCLNKNF